MRCLDEPDTDARQRLSAGHGEFGQAAAGHEDVGVGQHGSSGLAVTSLYSGDDATGPSDDALRRSMTASPNGHPSPTWRPR
jgi:hypothetical protein